MLAVGADILCILHSPACDREMSFRGLESSTLKGGVLKRKDGNGVVLEIHIYDWECDPRAAKKGAITLVVSAKSPQIFRADGCRD
jgi:hypothetical protein